VTLQLEAEREATRAAAATDAMWCAAAKATQQRVEAALEHETAARQRAEAAAEDARTEVAAVKAEVRPTAEQGLCFDTCSNSRWQV
jgi:hypothetical protein